MKHCKNCGRKVHDLYCPHCGQATKIERITGPYLWHECFHFLTHIEQGFWFTSWRMVRAPGETVRAFIAGRRKATQSPISFFVIWTTIFILLLYGIDRVFGENVVIDYGDYFGPSTTRLAIGHLNVVLTIVIPFQAAYLFLLIGRGTYNYFECLVAVVYAIGTVILFQFVFAVLAVIVHGATGQAVDLRTSDVFKIAYLSWFTVDLFRALPGRWKVMRGLVFLILAFGTFTAWRLYGLPWVLARLD
jgi:hypothetical protein